jgi:flagellar motor switch protein FliN
MNSRSHESESKGIVLPKIPEEFEFLSEVTIKFSAKLGGRKMLVRDLLALKKDTIIELDRLAGDAADLLINNIPFARGEVIMIGQSFGIRITEFLQEKK